MMERKRSNISYERYLSPVKEIIEQYDIPVTLRQIYYRAISDPYDFLEPIDKNTYQNLGNAIVKMRKRGDIDWRKIVDHTRGIIGGDYRDMGDPDAYIKNQLDDLEDCELYYHRPLWGTQKNYLEVWTEKDAIAGVVNAIASPYKVAVLPVIAYGSFTILKESLDRFSEHPDKEKIILYFGDWNPTGKDVDKSLQERLSEYGFGEVKIKIKRIAIWDYQAKHLKKKPHYAKKTDTRYKKFVEEHGEETWEVDAIPPDELQSMVKEAIEYYIDWNAWDKRKKEIADKQEYIRGKMTGIMKNIRGN